MCSVVHCGEADRSALDMIRDSDFSPDIFMLGTPEEADRFLVARLRDESASRPAVYVVVNWIRLLKARGDAFASHVVACHYWLYEHSPGYNHETVFRPTRGNPGWLTPTKRQRTRKRAA